MAESATASGRASGQGYEPDDVSIRGVLIVAAVSLIVLALIGITLWGMVALLAESHRQTLPSRLEQTRIERPPPRLQASPKDDLAVYRAQEDASLHRWAWVDRSAGIVQIPIERAMAELARRGWPQPDRPDLLVPPRAAEPQAPPSAGEPPAEPAAEPDAAPGMSPQETGPAQAQPESRPQ